MDLVLEAYADSDRKPVFDPRDNFFILTPPNLNCCEKAGDGINDGIKGVIPSIKEDRLGNVETCLLRIISMRPGLSTLKPTEKLRHNYSTSTINTVRNALRRKLFGYVEYKGSKKTGGFCCEKRGVVFSRRTSGFLKFDQYAITN